jgi:hypothetical protein
MNTPLYTPSDLLRIELLHYDTPLGIPAEVVGWRDLSRKLLAHVEALQNEHVTCKNYSGEKFVPFKFPNTTSL